MDKDKSIIEKFSDTVKDIANSASEALKAEEPPKVEQASAGYVPFAAEGLVTDPLQVPPLATRPPRRKRTAKTAKTSSSRKATARRGAPKKARKAKTSTRRSARAASQSAAKRSAKRTTRRRTAKRAAKRSRR